MVSGGKISALGWSLLIHAVIATGFIFTFRFTTPAVQQPTGQVIQAEAISQDALDAREAAKEAARQAELRRQREAAERAAAEQRRREEAARQAELQRIEEARQRAAAEARRKREAEEARRAAELEAQRKAEAERQRQLEAERQRKAAEEAKRKAAEEARLKAEAEQRRREEAARKAREQELLQSLEAEEQRMEAIRSGKQAQWIGVIQNKVMRNWSQPPNLADNFYCEFEVRQIPGGEVVSVQAGKCDNEVLRRSAEAAIWKASPFPPPPDPSLFDQYVTVIFQPEG